MSAVYTPDPTNRPTSYTAPSEGDPRTAASVDVMLEGLADNIAGLTATLRPQAFFSYTTNAIDTSQSWTTTTFAPLASFAQLVVAGSVANDVLDVRICGMAYMQSPAAAFESVLAMYYYDGLHSPAAVTGTQIHISKYFESVGHDVMIPFSMSATLVVDGASPAIYVYGKTSDASDICYLGPSMTISVTRYRGT